MTSVKYDRQIKISGWNQDKLSNARVAVIGAGALGNHVCLGLIGLGIGTIKIYDYDTIESHNLNRQSLFCEEDIGHNKAEILAERLEKRNSGIIIVGIDEKIEESTIDSVIRNVDLVIDCVDLIHVRKILNYYCIQNDIPMIHGGLSWFGGQVGILSRKTPCINCIFPESVQKQELQQETSCIYKPEPSVVYTSQIVAGLMVKCVREVLMPLPSDPPRKPGLIKFDFRFEKPFYFEPIQRKEKCECRKILKEVAPEILKKERADKRKQKEMEK
ncbi:MAG: HesA/MoeB/ThiF family protein, partial [Promethearchaeota archaeon]